MILALDEREEAALRVVCVSPHSAAYAVVQALYPSDFEDNQERRDRFAEHLISIGKKLEHARRSHI